MGDSRVVLALIQVAEGAAITGPIADVAALVEHLHATGAALITTPANDLRITLPAAPLIPRRAWSWSRRPKAAGARPRRIGWPRWTTTLAVLAAVLSVTAVAALVWMVWLALAWLIAHLAVIGAVLAAVALVSIVAGTGACTTTVRITHRH